MWRRIFSCLGLCAAALTVPVLRAQEVLKPGRLSKEETAALEPGLTLRFCADRAAVKVVDVRRARLPALHVPAGSSATPLLDPGPVAARWQGYLKAPLKGDYSFQLAGTGSAVLTINGADLRWDAAAKIDAAGPAALVRGYNKLELVYNGPDRGDASLRLSWMGEGFPWEPVPPELFFSRGDDADLAAGRRLREGRLLHATLGCAHCHALPGQRKRADCAMPELEHRAPSLADAGRRLQTDWLAQWIADPRSLRSSATMPKLLHGDAGTVKQQAADLAAYIESLRSPLTPHQSPVTPNQSPVTSHQSPVTSTGADLVKEGQRLFEKLGCLGCHHLKETGQEDRFGRLALAVVPVKFKPGALEEFLRRPHEHYPWSRMPDFRLDAKESSALAAYLIDRAREKAAVSASRLPASAERGTKLFGALGCANCHTVKPGESPAPARLPAPSSQAKGCLTGNERSRVPDFRLTENQRQALRDFLATDGSSLLRETAAEFSARQVRALQCQTCHQRDGAGSRLWEVLAEEGDGTLPEIVPSLTWTGQKLRTPWTVRLLAGQHDHRARPWLKLRMPAFPARAELLAAGLAHEHGYPAGEDSRPAPDAVLAAIGAKLIENVGGFNCVSCHGVGKRSPVAPFEAPGINLLDAVQRLRYDYYPRWMIDPARVETATKMPKFAQDGRSTALKNVLDGDAHRQFDAIWHYMSTLPRKNER